MAETSTGFTDSALQKLLRGIGAGEDPTRRRGLELFRAMPMPSPETEEWRYTDLRELDLSAFVPSAEEHPADSLDDVKPDILEAAGDVGERAGLCIQHNSTVVTAHLSPDLAARGVVFCSLDEAAVRHPELVAGRIHGIVPVRPDPVHRPARRVPARGGPSSTSRRASGSSCPCRP